MSSDSINQRPESDEQTDVFLFVLLVLRPSLFDLNDVDSDKQVARAAEQQNLVDLEKG